MSYTALLLRNISQLSEPNKTEYPTPLYNLLLTQRKNVWRPKKKLCMHAFQTAIPHKFDWASWFFFPFIFYLLIINTPHLKTEMSWISIVGVSSNVIILESSNYKILSWQYSIMFIKQCEIQDNLNQQNFTSNCTFLTKKKKMQKEIPSETYIDLVSLPLQTWNCRPLGGNKTIYANTQSS